MKLPPTPRRSQRERRESTIAKLVDATIESLLAVGYKGTTVREICARAGVSHGGLFRFFPSVIELVIVASEEVAARQIREFDRRFAEARIGSDPIRAALALLRDATRSPTNAVFYELLLAARTDATLRQALEVSMNRYYDAIRTAARGVPGMERVPADLFDTLLFTAVYVFDGESLARTVLPESQADEPRIQLLCRLFALVNENER